MPECPSTPLEDQHEFEDMDPDSGARVICSGGDLHHALHGWRSPFDIRVQSVTAHPAWQPHGISSSDPLDLGVFCVEPGRWTATSTKFGSLGVAMAQPAVRARAMSDKDQAKVWSEVRNAQAGVASRLPAAAASEVAGTSSYAGVM